MTSEAKSIALLVTIRPKKPEDKQKILDSLSSLAPFFRRPSTQCTTRSLITPATRKGAIVRGVDTSPADHSAQIGLIEIFTHPSALTAVQSSPEYTEFFAQVEREGLFTRELTAWYPTAGFVARRAQTETGPAGVVMLAKFVCKDGEGVRDKLVDVLGTYCSWVEQNEPTTLTYSVMTRPKTAPNEVLLFERYKDLAALAAHGKTTQFRAMSKATGPLMQVKKTVLTEWEELEGGSFVSNTPGGAVAGIGSSTNAQAKL
ncbi:hypothetical protein HRR83_002293 [Exophiala dermatitidis]|uniref:ABM domain-containing protein n=3 Tax=Exophiala dermatitidis TaxID=5970 RepID=H6BY02_EXODN|nr:uncharacterized protein HMPREF1120_04700 [Exophiala dermatitidis NIH/UT8656]KAJ4520309.1 hypothetical protein HRR75_002174 [Exophiala dermatitidis]EHY56625.1 hypothetical protein HMPREF1120_04700 [Exophiala dermatitidis NIH/UT8656]KAJ4524173.1 hypothetical protein HRR74_002370 [Exophiala dermatitidis]KAJ4525555.1 hypothetical protein HRR73_002285 [Exophiala dermatitidis]KAJ4536872.1 hypothetical protein HRR76_004898 [Exophiala dermatitidis]